MLSSLVILTACGSSTGTTNNSEEIGKAMEVGTPMKCIVKMVDETAPAQADMVYYVDGDNTRSEIMLNGKLIIAIQKGDTSFMDPSSIMGDSDCNWLTSTDEDESDEIEDVDFDYELFESDPMYDMTCTFGKVDSKQFETKGKVCNMEEMMQQMMNGGMNLGNMDLSGMGM